MTTLTFTILFTLVFVTGYLFLVYKSLSNKTPKQVYKTNTDFLKVIENQFPKDINFNPPHDLCKLQVKLDGMLVTISFSLNKDHLQKNHGVYVTDQGKVTQILADVAIPISMAAHEAFMNQKKQQLALCQVIQMRDNKFSYPVITNFTFH